MGVLNTKITGAKLKNDSFWVKKTKTKWLPFVFGETHNRYYPSFLVMLYLKMKGI